MLDRDGCVAAEPALAAVKDKFAGGLRLPQDETGDCHMFTQALALEAEKLGVRFMFNVGIEGLDADATRDQRRCHHRSGVMQADAYVLALGSWSPRLVRPLGISLPVYPVKGYSITVPITDPDGAPVSTVMDESYKVAITRLGRSHPRRRHRRNLRLFRQALCGASRDARPLPDRSVPARRRSQKATFWSGLRPMTPDGPPVIGATRYSNLHLNTGHGTLGWTMACGSGRVLADLLSGRKPDIDTKELSISRYEHRFG